MNATVPPHCAGWTRLIPDALIFVLVAAAAFTSSHTASLNLDRAILTKTLDDTWFEADVGRTYQNMTERWSNHYRVKVHPLFSLSSHPLVYLLRARVGVSPEAAVRLVTASLAALWAGALFGLFRLLSCPRFDACLFSFMAITSSASLFWFAVPETYSFGSLSIVLALILVAVANTRRLSDRWFVAVCALTLSYTVSNVMIGILAAIAARPWRRVIQISVNAFVIVALLWGLQKTLYPSAVFFLGDHEEARYVVSPDLNRLGDVMRVLAFDSIVMPDITTTAPVGERFNLSVQHSSLTCSRTWTVIPVVAWALLLAAGVWALLTLEVQAPLRFLVAAGFLGQLMLHVVYGPETFLYVLHVAPLLLTAAVLGSLTRARSIVLALAAVVVIAGGFNNYSRFLDASLLIAERASALPRPSAP